MTTLEHDYAEILRKGLDNEIIQQGQKVKRIKSDKVCMAWSVGVWVIVSIGIIGYAIIKQILS